MYQPETIRLCVEQLKTENEGDVTTNTPSFLVAKGRLMVKKVQHHYQLGRPVVSQLFSNLGLLSPLFPFKPITWSSSRPMSTLSYIIFICETLEYLGGPQVAMPEKSWGILP